MACPSRTIFISGISGKCVKRWKNFGQTGRAEHTDREDLGRPVGSAKSFCGGLPGWIALEIMVEHRHKSGTWLDLHSSSHNLKQGLQTNPVPSQLEFLSVWLPVLRTVSFRCIYTYIFNTYTVPTSTFERDSQSFHFTLSYLHLCGLKQWSFSV